MSSGPSGEAENGPAGEGVTSSSPAGPDPASPDESQDVIGGLDAELADLVDDAGQVSSEQAGEVVVELTELEQTTKERDDYLDGFRRLQAEFENYKKAVGKREADARARANDVLVAELLPVLDACAMASAAGSEDVARVEATLLEALTKQGLEVLNPVDSGFDPAQHEAVMHEESDGSDGLVVADVLRVGYGWKGHVIRPAMVKTRG